MKKNAAACGFSKRPSEDEIDKLLSQVTGSDGYVTYKDFIAIIQVNQSHALLYPLKEYLRGEGFNLE
jgi:hypothetical protein